ncbi:hypothetical protein RRG08_031457 [Elysia crispata]|uniref:Uncharacterized protein n=1 Tax=Elysia crispata TaxID=231223 RepID=A0AAE0ZPX2_9GAST|nr:hypothetical protein RRG08_031457 [Elysia crispata]
MMISPLVYLLQWLGDGTVKAGRRLKQDPITTSLTEGGKIERQKTLSKNIYKPPRTKTSNAHSAVDPGSTFSLFLPASFISDLVKYTNLEGERVDGVMWRPTKTSNAHSAVDPGSTFNLFLPASFISDLVKYTNLEGERVDGVMWRPTKTSNAQSAVDPGSTFNLFLPASIISDLVK